MKEIPLTPEFCQACFEEMRKQQMVIDAAEGLVNMGPAYQAGVDQTSQTVGSSMFARKMVAAITTLCDSRQSASVKVISLYAAVINCVKFGMYLQRRMQEKGSLLL